jgi:hypothetical protein
MSTYREERFTSSPSKEVYIPTSIANSVLSHVTVRRRISFAASCERKQGYDGAFLLPTATRLASFTSQTLMDDKGRDGRLCGADFDDRDCS